jgi:phosphoglycolate phosphatase-like HAD superfamily hydrolase
MSKRVKYINTGEANKRIGEAHDYRKVVPAFREAIKSFEGMKTIDEIDTFLNDKTGFKNTSLSATAMGLEDQYKLVSKYLGKINLKNYDKNGLVTQKYKDKCFLDCTVYHTDEDVALFDKVEKVLDKLNALELPLGCVFNNHNGEFLFNEQRFNTARQLLRGSRYRKETNG